MTERIRLLQVLEATVGGTRRHLLSLAANIDREVFDVEVACPRSRHGLNQDDSFVGELQSYGVPIHYVDMRRELSPLSDLRSLWTLIALVRQQRYDVIHVHSSKAGFLGRLAAKACRTPVIYTPNGFYFLDAHSQLLQKVFQQLERTAGHWTDRLIAVSLSEKNIAVQERLVPEHKIAVIPNAVDSLQIQADDLARTHYRELLRIPTGTACVGTISRFISQKDPDTFVRMARAILDEFPQTVFVWCGEGPLREQTEKLAEELQIHEAFRFLGFRHDAEKILNAYDIFVLTSIFEGLPYSLLEAMSMSLPVVATDVVGSRDVVKHDRTGYLAPPHEPLTIASAVNHLIQDAELRRTFGAEARAQVVAEYDLKEMVRKTEGLYRELSAGRFAAPKRSANR